MHRTISQETAHETRVSGALAQVTSLLLVDDHPVARIGIAQIASADPDLAVCGEASSVLEAHELLNQHRPSIAILDLELGGAPNFGLIAHIAKVHPETAMLILTIYDEHAYAQHCLELGVRGYVNKCESPATILAAIHRVRDGRIFVSNPLEREFQSILEGGTESDEDGAPQRLGKLGALTKRESQIFQLIGEGLKTREIATQLCISTKTVDSHRERIKAKLNLKNANQLTHYAVRHASLGTL